MRRLRLTFIIGVTLLSGCIVIPTYNGEFSLKATHPNEQDVQLNNVLLIGTGAGSLTGLPGKIGRRNE
jgi:hypothetical protein